ncbi:MAG: DUF2059 domain-containing protein [Treponema sp.]|nr:DUF2059 domain-containing protein [Treponema sp.]
MKKLIFVLLLTILTGSLSIYGQSKNEDILKLLRVSGTDKQTQMVIDELIALFEQTIPDIPAVVWVKFKDKIKIDDLLEMCIPIYDKYYTHNDIKEMIKFYESPIGKKMVDAEYKMTNEISALGEKWGEKIGNEIVNELINDGYF